MKPTRTFAILLLAATAALSNAVPAAAQRVSEGHAFLEAVRDRDGTKVTDALNEPGSTVVNARDISSGETGLHIATKRRDVTWIRFLTSRGGDPNIADKKGVTPLQIAASLGFADGVEALVKAGADVENANAAGETALISAVHRRDSGLVRMLLDNGASADRADNSGRTARDYARLQGERGIMMQIIEQSDEARSGKGEAVQYGPSL
ncbi:ankyrin repeat domain-containing protein [Parapontixanthobacter aurantiacus]|uniref:ankyrin repeat domain-containing protein n=1 Tax=Parapontixanthobacter aurantiacus TaxID=1463599 RepID=UPI00301DBA84